MNRSGRFLVRMAVFVLAVCALAAALFGPLSIAFMGNPGINGVILGILLCGIIYIFRQVLLLSPEMRLDRGFPRAARQPRPDRAERAGAAPPGADGAAC